MSKRNKLLTFEKNSGDPQGVVGCLDESLIRSYVTELIEARLREADISDGSRVPVGSDRHIKDLEGRIADLVRWRDKEKKGTENRANYSRLINRLRSQLRVAQRIAQKSMESKSK